MIVLHHYLASGAFNAVALTGTWYWYQELVVPGTIPVPAPSIGSSTCNIHENVYAKRYLVLTVISLDNAPRGAQSWWKIEPRGVLRGRGAVFPQKKKKKNEERSPAGVGLLFGAPTGHTHEHPTLRHFGVTHRQTCDRAIRTFVGKSIELLLDFKLMERFECEK